MRNMPRLFLAMPALAAMCLLATALQAHTGSGIAVDRDGQVFFLDTGSGLWKIDAQGKLTHLSPLLYHWLALDADDRFARARFPSGARGDISKVGTKPTLLVSSDYPIAIGQDGNLYYPSESGGALKIMRMLPSGETSVLATLPATASGPLQHINGIAAGPDGSIYYTENSAIRRISAQGEVSTAATVTALADGPSIPGTDQHPYLRGLAVDAGGVMYVADNGDARVLKITPEGKITTLLQLESPWSPTAVALLGDDLYVLEFSHTASDVRQEWMPRVRKIAADGRTSILVTVDQMPGARPAAANPAADQALPPLPEGAQGIAARYPGDKGIASDPAVIFHDDFEAANPDEKWDNVYQEHCTRLATEPDNVHGGKRALEFRLPKQDEEISNAVVKKLGEGYDAVFLRYYSRFDPGFDQKGSGHNGGLLAAISGGLAYATPGVRADGRNKFIASFECWRDDEKPVANPGELNIYLYHPEQRSEWGDHFFPSGTVLPWTYKPGDFGPHFVKRPEVIPKLGRWHCHEFMVQANTPGRRDGRIACWVDGKLIADFPNLRLRDVASLKINYAALDLHHRSNATRENRKWYDDVVVAREYVGPMAR